MDCITGIQQAGIGVLDAQVQVFVGVDAMDALHRLPGAFLVVVECGQQDPLA